MYYIFLTVFRIPSACCEGLEIHEATFGVEKYGGTAFVLGVVLDKVLTTDWSASSAICTTRA